MAGEPTIVVLSLRWQLSVIPFKMENLDVYNTIFNVTSCANLPVKLFTLYIVITKTPRHLRHDSFFILDVMCWSYLGNTLLAIAHPVPAYPAQCYRLEGPFGQFSDSKTVGFALFLALYFCALHWGVGVFLAFFYRYFSSVHPKLAAKIKPLWAFGFCAVVHLASMAVFSLLIFFADVSYYNHPDTGGDLQNSLSLFCFSFPDWERLLYALGSFLGFAVIVALAGLLFREIGRSEGIVHADTLKIQRRLLWNLIILTSIVLLMGTAPLVIGVLLAFLYPYFPHANTIFMVSIITCANHGATYAIATLILFKPYRQAVSKMWARVFRSSAVTPVKVNVERK